MQQPKNSKRADLNRTLVNIAKGTTTFAAMVVVGVGTALAIEVAIGLQPDKTNIIFICSGAAVGALFPCLLRARQSIKTAKEFDTGEPRKLIPAMLQDCKDTFLGPWRAAEKKSQKR